MTYKAVIFDLDGVLVNTHLFHERAWKFISSNLKVKFEEKMAEDLRGLGRKEGVRYLLSKNERIDNSNETVEYWAKKKNEKFLEYIEEISKKNLIRGALSSLKDCRKSGYKIVLASSSANAKRIIEKLEIETYFDYIVDVGMKKLKSKPSSEIFLDAVKYLNLDYQDILIVEDSIYGIVAANQLGIDTLLISESINEEDFGNVIAKIPEINEWCFKTMKRNR